MSDATHAKTGILVSWCAVNWMRSPSSRGEPTRASIADLFGRGIEQWHAARAINPQRAARILAGRLVVRELVTERGLDHWAGFEPTSLGRKPTMTDSDIDFSIAHSAHWLLAAIVQTGSVGVDVETHVNEFDHPGLLRRMCTADELARANELDVSARRSWLATLWTAKEAVSKLDGCGLRGDFRQLHLGDLIPVGEAEHPIAASIAISPHGRAGSPDKRGLERDRFTLLHPQIGNEGVLGSRVMT